MSAGPITLVDAEEFNRQYPDSFEIPFGSDRENVSVDDAAKVMFTDGTYVERMWVRVTANSDDGYVGELDSAPTILPMRSGEVVRFQARHIMALYFAGAGSTK